MKEGRPLPDYASIRQQTEAKRRALLARIRRKTAPEASPTEDTDRALTLLSLASEIQIVPCAADAAIEVSVPEGRGPEDSGGTSEFASMPVVVQDRMSVAAPEMPARVATGVDVRVDEPVSWIERMGVAEARRPGLASVADLLAGTSRMESGTVHVASSWPSRWANPVLAWSLSSLSNPDPNRDGLRVLFVGCGRIELQGLEECEVDRQAMNRVWPPKEGLSAAYDAMRTAFGRLDAEAPARLAVRDLVPTLHVCGHEDQPWGSKWTGFLGGHRRRVQNTRHGRYDLRWQDYGRSRDGRPFGFLVPRASTGSRCTREIASLPGPIDLVVVDASATRTSSWVVAEELKETLLAVAAGFPEDGVVPPTLVLVSGPVTGRNASIAVREMIRCDILGGPRALTQTFYRGRRSGTATSRSERLPERIVVQSSFSSEHGIVGRLFEIASKLEQERPKTAFALAQAAAMLCGMARTILPPCAEGKFPALTTRSFSDEAMAVREAIRSEGTCKFENEIRVALERGGKLATDLLKKTPASMAFEEAIGEAASGARVCFVVERGSDARDAQISERILLQASRAVEDEIPGDADLLVLACAGAEAIRIFMSVAALPREVRMILTPFDARNVIRSVHETLHAPELNALHARARLLQRRVPPELARVASLVPDRRLRPSTFKAVAADRARAELVAAFDDGLPEAFAPGATVIVCQDGECLARRSRDLQPGDLVVLPPPELIDEIARAMGWNDEQALADEAVKDYKRAVASWIRGKGAGIGPQEIARRMQAMAEMPRPSTQAIRYWLSAADRGTEAKPFATRRADWFQAFCHVIGYEPGASDALLRHFDRHRSRLRRDGHVRMGLVEKLLFDRFDLAIHGGLGQADVDRYRSLALLHVRLVASVEKGDLWEDDD